MGVGTPEDIVEAVARGVDLFDCVLPTRNARNGYLFVPWGAVRIRNCFHIDLIFLRSKTSRMSKTSRERG